MKEQKCQYKQLNIQLFRYFFKVLNSSLKKTYKKLREFFHQISPNLAALDFQLYKIFFFHGLPSLAWISGYSGSHCHPWISEKDWEIFRHCWLKNTVNLTNIRPASKPNLKLSSHDGLVRLFVSQIQVDCAKWTVGSNLTRAFINSPEVEIVISVFRTFSQYVNFHSFIQFSFKFQTPF